jgi:hypothetical protein
MISQRATVPTGTAADAIGVSRATLSRWNREHKVTPASTTAGGHLRWNIDDLRRQLADKPHEHEHQADEVDPPVTNSPRGGQKVTAEFDSPEPVKPPSAGDAAGRAYEGFKTARRRK